MEVIEQHLEEEKIDVNSTVFVRSNIEFAETNLPASTSFLERMKWPIIGSLAAIASLIFIGLLYICQLKNPNSGGVQVEINNAASSNNESPSCSREVANQINIPILPSAPQFQGGAQQFQEHIQDKDRAGNPAHAPAQTTSKGSRMLKNLNSTLGGAAWACNDTHDRHLRVKTTKINAEKEYLDHWDNTTPINDKDIDEKTLTSPILKCMNRKSLYLFQTIMSTHSLFVNNYIPYT